MKKNNMMKTIRNWLAFGVTVILLVVLFGIIFISLDLVTPGPSFFLELSIIIGLNFTMRVFWYDFAEEKRLSEQDISDAREVYFRIIDDVIEDSNDLDKFLVILNQENKTHYIKNKIGSRNPKNMAVKNKWICFWHPSYKNLTKEEIGQVRYDKLYFKYQRKADKIKPIKSEDIMALSDSDMLYDAKNYAKDKKRRYQTISTILSTVFTILIASIAFKEIMMNWENVFRYITYIFSIAITIAITVNKAYKTTGDETLDWFNRLEFIVDKYATYKEKGGSDNGI